MDVNIRKVEIIPPIIVLISGILSAMYLLSIDNYSLLYYGDSISHLVAGRKFVDWVNPGFSQMGTVWLPVLHFMLIPFALNNTLFTSGLAGTVVSLPALALASFFMTKIVYRWHKSERLALLSGLIFAINPSLIYMGIISMQESLLLFFVISSLYYIYTWYDESGKGAPDASMYLYIAIPLIILATLTRYEAWLLPPALLIIIAKRILSKNYMVNTTVILASLAGFVGISFWLIWNALSYGDALAFMNVPFYSYIAQATARPFRDALFLHPLSSARVLLMALEVMYGAPLLILSLIGVTGFIIKSRSEWGDRLLFSLMFGLPTIATYIAMVAGVGELFHQGGGIWFNSRFLVLTSGLISFGGVSLLTLTKRKTLLTLLVILLISSVTFGSVRQLGYPNPPMVMKEAYAGFSYRNETVSAIEIAEVLGDAYQGGTILMLTSSGEAHKIMVFSGIPLRNFRDLFAGDPWPIRNGERMFTDWTIVSNHPSGDGLIAVGYLEVNSILLNKNYKIVESNEFFTLMHRR